MHESNLALLRGCVANEPTSVTLADGSVVTNLDVTTSTEAGKISVPIAVVDRDVAVTKNDEVVVAGFVRRRFFQANGATQSRTEVVASSVLRTSRRRAVERCIEEASALLGDLAG